MHSVICQLYQQRNFGAFLYSLMQKKHAIFGQEIIITLTHVFTIYFNFLCTTLNTKKEAITECVT